MSILKKITGFLFLIGGGLYPLYLFPSGYPQVSDLIFVFFMISSFVYMLSVHRFDFKGFPKEWVFLVLVVIFVSCIWAIILQEFKVAFNMFFWIYNFLLSVCLYSLLRINYEYFIKIVLYSVCLALLVSAFGLVLHTGASIRSSGFFNNPNQLAYFSLLALVMILFIKDFKLDRVYYIPVLISGVLGILLSASLAAIASSLFIFASYAMSTLNRKRVIGSFFVSFILFIGVIFLGGENLSENLTERAKRFDTKVESVSDERNYNRIFSNLDYVLLGAGEGEYQRFGAYESLEIHSSFGNLIFSYGILGFSLFIILLYRVFKNLNYIYSLAFVAPLLYSVTHMGLRSTFFWILIVIGLSLKGRKLV